MPEQGPRINWWPPVVTAGLVGIGFAFGWHRAGQALGGLAVVATVVLLYDGVRWWRRRRGS